MQLSFDRAFDFSVSAADVINEISSQRICESALADEDAVSDP